MIMASASGIGHPDRDPLGQRICPVGRNRPARGDGQRVGRRVLGDDADHLGREAQRVARRDYPAIAAAEPDRHIDRV